jgi:ribA/ribD-fused uncharacterized protein
MTAAVTAFRGPYSFLSNFHIEADGLTGEHRFQAAKCVTGTEVERILSAPSPAAAKAAGRRVQLRPDWETVKIDVMRNIVAHKFEDPELRQQLLATDDAELIEGNTWGDRFWGTDNGRGANWLGRILMETRAAIRAGAGE